MGQGQDGMGWGTDRGWDRPLNFQSENTTFHTESGR